MQLDKSILAIVIFFTTLFFLYIPFYFFNKKRELKSFNKFFDFTEAFACGIFLGLGLIVLLFLSNNIFRKINPNYAFAFLIAGLVFLILLLVEHLAHKTASKNTAIIAKPLANDKSLKLDAKSKKPAKGQTVLPLAATLTALLFHSFFAGLALGFTDKLASIYLVFIAIFAHKWAVSFALATEFNNSPINRKWVYFWLFCFAIATPAGILIGTYVNFANTDLLFGIFTAISAGTFIYIGSLHGLYNSVLLTKCCDLKAYSFTILGFALVAGIAAIN